MELTTGQKSAAVRRWNSGERLPQIARRVAAEVADVEAFLQARKGYPGTIECDRGRFHRPPRLPDPEAPPRPTPSLPKLRFMGEC